MGTRADFYVGVGTTAEWLGSIAWDGYPEGICPKLLAAKSEKGYRQAVADFAKTRDDWTSPEEGWPWPWKDSRTTDYAYAFVDTPDEQGVKASCFGSQWYAPGRDSYESEWPKTAVFPDMTDKKNVVTGGKRSGIIVIGG